MADAKSSVVSRSVVDRGTTLKGTLVASSPVLVLGLLEGEISGPGIEIEAGGKLVGKAKVGQLRCRGELSGQFEADDVELAGRVHEQTVIRARTLLVPPEPGQEGTPAVTFNDCLIEVGDPPSKEQVISRLLAFAPAPTPPPRSPGPGPEPAREVPRAQLRVEPAGRVSMKGELLPIAPE